MDKKFGKLVMEARSESLIEDAQEFVALSKHRFARDLKKQKKAIKARIAAMKEEMVRAEQMAERALEYVDSQIGVLQGMSLQEIDDQFPNGLPEDFFIKPYTVDLRPFDDALEAIGVTLR